MGSKSSPRKGSLQFYPRKRAGKFLPRVNWLALSGTGLLGFIGYKAGMITAHVKDNTPNSLTKNKKISIPCTIVEIPPIKIYSVRFYKNNNVIQEVVVDNADKELRKIIKLGKKIGKVEDIKPENYDDIRVIAYTLVKKTRIKKKPDLTELALSGNLDEKLSWIKAHIGKEILASEILKDWKIADVRGLTKGKGIQGPVKRFGINLKSHKSEKGRRRPGSIGPWHPAHTTFRVAMSGQLGMFSRIIYNNLILKTGKAEELEKEFKHYGKVKTEYLILKGSIQGPVKRQILLTQPLRATKKINKLNYEFLGLE